MILLRSVYWLIVSAVAVSLYLVSLPAQAIKIDVGGGLAVVSARVADEKTSETVATIASSSFTPAISLVGDENYFGDETRWGWTYQVWAGRFEVNKQKIDGSFSSDFDTKITGSYLYGIPMVFYRFGDRMAKEPVLNWHITLGIGYGLSYSDITGNVRLTEESNDPNAKTVDVSASGLFLSYALLAKFTYNNFFFSITDNVPQIKDGDNDLIFRINNFSYIIGYSLSFDFEFSDLF